ncbi:MAG: penicillin acylase family protein [Cyclobacteriaceae bacterium]|nr:penicillin acylase family protein [Cyclobacteriaceae bacterium]
MTNRLKLTLVVILISGSLVAQPFTKAEIDSWKSQAKQVTIIRDTWGIPHVYGKTDGDAVFGFLYAQCEDDFERVEMNYISAVGRLAEVEGESKLYHDLRTRLFYDSVQAMALYKASPAWLKRLCDGFANGINYYLYTHPQVRPKLLNRFQPWMPFLFSEGSIGGDLASISVGRVKNFYGDGKTISQDKEVDNDNEPEPRGSNGFAIAPSRSATGNALLLINPHTSFYFRPEVHVTSEEGLNAYGAVTWGQFFVYQGFNQYCGWMHTTSQADVMDEYLEAVMERGDSVFYKHGKAIRPMAIKTIRLAYVEDGKKKFKEFTTYATHHGPIIAREDTHWVSLAMMVEPLKALTQSYQRTRATGLEDYKKVMDLKANSSNNTVFADNKGNIAYWHGNFIPKRNPQYDWNKPLDGSDPGTDWLGLHEVSEIVHSINPSNGWIQNCNSTPFTLAGDQSPRQDMYPAYMAPDAQNPRGINAERVLKREPAFTLDKLIAAAYDPHLAGFEKLIPALITAYESGTNSEMTKKLEEPIKFLRAWDLGYSKSSVPTTLAIYWGQELQKLIRARILPGSSQWDVIEFMASESSASEKLAALSNVIDELNNDFGTWKVAWGDVNRFQRLTGKIVETYNDDKPSLPIASTSSFWGSLAAYGSKKYPGTKKMYGSVGNSFVAVVEFGKEVKAKSLLAGGNNNNPQSPHFNDQADLYSTGRFKDVWFYKKDVLKHAERTYHPGDN